MKITAIAPWFGGNRMLAHSVGEALRGCRWVGIPFAGGMSELAHIDAPTILVNDKHRHVVNLAMCLADSEHGPRLYRQLRRLPFHPDTLRVHQGLATNSIHSVPDPHAAQAYFVSQWMGRSGQSGTDRELSGKLPIRWNANGGDSNTRYRSAVKSINSWRRILQKCNFSVMDCFAFLEKCHDEDGHGIYCDPPFPDAGEKYTHSFTKDQHMRLAEVLASFAKTRIVCRFYDHPLIRELYGADHWEWREQEGRKQSNAKAAEVLLVNKRETQGSLFQSESEVQSAKGV